MKKIITLLALAFCLNSLAQCPITVTGDTIICQGWTGTNLYVHGASTYTWSQSMSTAPPTLLNANGDSVNVNPPGIPSPYVTYSVVGTNSVGCISQVVAVTVQPKPLPIYSPNDTICKGAHAQLSVTGMPANTIYHWGAAFGAGLGSNAGSIVNETPIYYNVNHGFADTTIIDTILVHVPGCPNYAPHIIQVIVKPKAVTSFTLTQDAAPYTWDAYPTYSSNVISATWNWGDGTSTNGLYPSHTYSAAGSYSICVSVSNGFCNTNYCQSDSVYRLAYNSLNSNMVYINVLSSAVGINQYLNLNSNISIYPNPSNGIINITNTKNIDELKVSDMLGQVVYEAKPNATTNATLQLTNAGVYFISITAGKELSTKKVIVSK